MVNRRTVLLAGGGVALAGAGLGGIAWAAPAGVSANGFRRCVNEVFGVTGTSVGAVDVRLTAVRDIESSSPRHEQFSLLFSGPSSQPFAEGSYTVEHYASGRRYAMYLQPAGIAESGALYRADFSLI